MSWEWSHSHEGIENVYNNIHNPEVVSTDTVKECIAEFAANDADGFNEDKYNDKMTWLNDLDLSHECLADTLWDLVQEQAICNNGGFDAWICPFGCHMVSFDLIKKG